MLMGCCGVWSLGREVVLVRLMLRLRGDQDSGRRPFLVDFERRGLGRGPLDLALPSPLVNNDVVLPGTSPVPVTIGKHRVLIAHPFPLSQSPTPETTSLPQPPRQTLPHSSRPTHPLNLLIFLNIPIRTKPPLTLTAILPTLPPYRIPLS